MNAKHFNGELRKIIDRGVTEGVLAGEMTFAEFVGVIEIFKLQAVQVIHRQIAAQEAQQKSVIITPPNGFKGQ